MVCRAHSLTFKSLLKAFLVSENHLDPFLTFTACSFPLTSSLTHQWSFFWNLPTLKPFETYYPHSGTRPRKCSLKRTTYTSQTSHLASASLHVKIMHCYRVGTKTCFPACMEERKKKTVWRCRIGRRMRKECHFSELNTEKLQTTNICNFNHILRDQKTSKLQHPQNLQNATGTRNGRKKNPSSKSTNTKTKNLAFSK